MLSPRGSIALIVWWHMNKDNLEEQKESLEIQKLQLDIRHSHRSFIAQILNTVVLGAVGVAALYFFQRPQVVELEATRLETEKSHVMSFLIATQSIPDDKVKRMIIHFLSESYPQYSSLRVIDKSIEENALISREIKEDDHGVCDRLRQEIEQQSHTIKELQEELMEEIAGVGKSRQAGVGPIANLLGEQISSSQNNLEFANKRRLDLKC